MRLYWPDGPVYITKVYLSLHFSRLVVFFPTAPPSLLFSLSLTESSETPAGRSPFSRRPPMMF